MALSLFLLPLAIFSGHFLFAVLQVSASTLNASALQHATSTVEALFVSSFHLSIKK